MRENQIHSAPPTLLTFHVLGERQHKIYSAPPTLLHSALPTLPTVNVISERMIKNKIHNAPPRKHTWEDDGKDEALIEYERACERQKETERDRVRLCDEGEKTKCTALRLPYSLSMFWVRENTKFTALHLPYCTARRLPYSLTVQCLCSG